MSREHTGLFHPDICHCMSKLLVGIGEDFGGMCPKR
jgi:hypothetical protein